MKEQDNVARTAPRAVRALGVTAAAVFMALAWLLLGPSGQSLAQQGG